jgi:hypothetical protein
MGLHPSQQSPTPFRQAGSSIAGLCMTEVTIENQTTIKNQTTINQVPSPRESVQQLLTAAGVEIPLALPCRDTKVYTKKKLPEERQHH